MVAGVRCTGGCAVCERSLEPGAPLAERALAQIVVALGEQVEGDERRGRLLGEHRDARLAAGWMRSDSRSKSRPRSVAITISPSTTQRSGRLARSGSTSSGK